MLDQQLVDAQPDDTREQLFTGWYEGLLAWAMHHTNQPRDAAEDLVQDAFVQFVLDRTRPEEIENGNLRRMLRYMHISGLSRSAQYLHEVALSVADADSRCRLGWIAIESPEPHAGVGSTLPDLQLRSCEQPIITGRQRSHSPFLSRLFSQREREHLCILRRCVDEWQRLVWREANSCMCVLLRPMRWTNGWQWSMNTPAESSARMNCWIGIFNRFFPGRKMQRLRGCY